MTQAELDAAIQYLQAGDVAGTNDVSHSGRCSVLTENGVFQQQEQLTTNR